MPLNRFSSEHSISLCIHEDKLGKYAMYRSDTTHNNVVDRTLVMFFDINPIGRAQASQSISTAEPSTTIRQDTFIRDDHRDIIH